MKHPRLRLRRPLERHLRAGHPWVYADALVTPGALASGTVVDVVSRDGEFVARGLYDPDSPIGVRIATLDAAEELDEAWVRARLVEALEARRGAFNALETNAFRWCNGEGDFLPGVVVDVYAQIAVVRFEGGAAAAWRPWVVAALVASSRGLDLEHVYERPRSGAGNALYGGQPPSPLEVRESGVRFAVDIVHGQKTGLFLDQRENRRAIRPYAGVEAAANLFGYTGGFSLHVALAGASSVVTVDSAAPALDAARLNFALNGLDPERHQFVCEDAFVWLEHASSERKRYGLMVVDPPSFAKNERAVSRALHAYRGLNTAAIGLLEPGGVLATASCSSHVGLEAFLGALSDAAARARRRVRVLEVRGQPPDHPSLPGFPEGRYLKFVILRVT